MVRIDALRERAQYNSRHRNNAICELLQYKGLLANTEEPIHNVKRAKVIRYILENYPVEMDQLELLAGRASVGEMPHEMRVELESVHEQPLQAGLFAGADGGGTAHRVADYDKILNVGIQGILAEIGRMESEITHGRPDAMERTYFYQACHIALDGLLRFAKRFQEALRDRSRVERNPMRRAEYERLASIFSHIPLHPARDFHEALQCVWFVQLSLSLTDDTSLSGRPDQYLYPYYIKGIGDGSLTREFAGELIVNYYLKLNELFDAWPASLTVGGYDSAGKPVYNELTELFIEAIEAAKLVNPSVAVGYNEHMPDALLLKCLDVLSKGYARPSIFNDRVVIQGLMAAGMTAEDARNYTHSTCVEMTSIGCSNIAVACPYINMIKGMEFLFNDGMEMVEQEDMFGNFNPGIVVKLDELSSFDAFYKAYKKILGGMIYEGVIWSNKHRYLRSHYGSAPLMSCFTNDCIKRGQDSSAGGARYNFAYPCFPGFSSTVDALNAIREAVYEKGRVSLAGMKRMLATNFENSELFRQYLLNRCPKYGNDQPGADELAVDLYNFIKESLAQYVTCLGGGYFPSYFSATMHGVFGKNTAATADGRLCKEALSECIGPVQGMDRRGPTAALNSIARLDHTYGIGGIAANFRFSKSLMHKTEANRAVASFIREFMRKGGFEIQLNVIDRETMLDAKDNPDQYRDLIVRVAGYSDYFVNLDPVIQDEIIRRTEHGQVC